MNIQSLESCYPGGLTSHSTIQIPEHVSQEASSLLQQVKYFFVDSVGSVLVNTLYHNSLVDIFATRTTISQQQFVSTRKSVAEITDTVFSHMYEFHPFQL